MRLFEGDSGLQAGEGIDPIIAAVGETFPAWGERFAKANASEDLRGRAERGAAEIARGDADDGEGYAIDEEDLVEDLGILAELFGPIGVTEHDEAMGTGGLIVRGREEAGEGGAEAEDGEIGAGDEMPLGGGRVALVGEVGTETAVGGDAGEDGLEAFEVAVHGVAKDGVAAAGVVSRVAAAARPVGDKIDEFGGAGGGKGASERMGTRETTGV